MYIILYMNIIFKLIIIIIIIINTWYDNDRLITIPFVFSNPCKDFCY